MKNKKLNINKYAYFIIKNDIIGETHLKEKLMTKVILKKEEHKSNLRKNRKLWISRNNHKSKFKDGVLNLSRNFMKYGDNKVQNNGNKLNNFKKSDFKN